MKPRYSLLGTIGILLLTAPSFANAFDLSGRQTGIASLQIIHNAADAGPLDFYLNGTLYQDDFDFRTATPFEVILADTYTLDVVAGQDADNTNPIFTTALTLGDVAYIIVAHGLVQPETDQPPFGLTVIENARVEAGSDNVEVAVIHGAPDLASIDIRLLDPVDNNNAFSLLANNITYNSVVLYQDLEPLGYNVEISTFDNDVQYEVFRLELQAYRGETLILIASGIGTSHSEGLDLIVVAADGTVAQAPVITTTTDIEAYPDGFALHGNYPNPFHPITTIHFDLPQAADVHARIFDIQGRHILTTPIHTLSAGEGRALPVDATGLPSGLYLYRVFAEGDAAGFAVWGKMMLVR